MNKLTSLLLLCVLSAALCARVHYAHSYNTLWRPCLSARSNGYHRVLGGAHSRPVGNNVVPVFVPPPTVWIAAPIINLATDPQYSNVDELMAYQEVAATASALFNLPAANIDDTTTPGQIYVFNPNGPQVHTFFSRIQNNLYRAKIITADKNAQYWVLIRVVPGANNQKTVHVVASGGLNFVNAQSNGQA